MKEQMILIIELVFMSEFYSMLTNPLFVVKSKDSIPVKFLFILELIILT